jgi:phosphoribosyl 1,2-cyclic phosphate phosphodiesterase
VDDSLLVDVSAQSFEFAQKLELDTSKVTDVFITHSHDDHFNLSQLVKFAESAGRKIKVWCHDHAVDNMKITACELEYITVEHINEMETFAVGDCEVTALPANHEMAGKEQALHYIIEKEGKTLFYGCDGGWFFGRTWNKIREKKFDCMILECTVGDHGGDVRLCGHNTMPMVELLAMGIRENGVLKENGIIMASHMGNLTHDRLPHAIIAEKLERFGVVAAYDGMTVEI